MDPYALGAAGLARLLDDEPAYRVRQVQRWLAKGVDQPERMTDLPLATRERLTRGFDAAPQIVSQSQADGGLTRKVLLRFADGEAIESVLMCYPRADHRRPRATVCVSTQAGCAMACPFCATGQAGLRRQLKIGEIVRQVTVMQRLLQDGDIRISGVPDHVTNVVFMGMGEPLANLGNTIGALRWLTDPDGFGLSARSITVSTIGVVPGVRRLAALNLPLTLAVSLHAPSDRLRDQLVPLNRRYPLADVLAACREFGAQTTRRLTFEYVLIAGINDGLELAGRLADLIGEFNAHVNLIPLNPTPGVPWTAPEPSTQRAFARVLEQAGVPVTIRHNRGADIDAACGQLYANYRLASGRRLPAPATAAR